MTAANPPMSDTHHALSPERKGVLWMAGSFAALIAVIVLMLMFFNWNMLRGPLARLASDATGRRVRIDGDLKVHLLTWQPRVSVGGLKIGQPAWVGDGDMAVADQVVVETRWKSLFQRKLTLPLLQIDHPVIDLRRDAKGKANWDFSKSTTTPSTFKMPAIERFIVDNGRLHYADAGRKMVIDGIVDSNEHAGGAQAHAFSLNGHGILNAKPFDITATGGPLLNVRLDQPYPFSGAVRMGDTHAEATGQLRRPFDLSAYTTTLHVKGPDLADLYSLTGIPLPNTPTYDLHGTLSHSGKLYDFDGINGRVGSSDLAGEFSVDTASGRPFVDARLRSHSLDFKDLATLFGGTPAKKATATPVQRQEVAALAAQQRFLPDAPLAAEKLRKIDARLVFTADTIKDTFLPLRSARMKLKLDHGLMTIDPLNFDFPQGSLASSISLDGRGAIPITSVDARLTNVELKNFVPGGGGANPPIEGVMAARVKLTGKGDSVHRAAAASNGAITVVIPHGHIRQAFAELLGVNAGKGLGLLLSKNNSQSDVRCGVASFDVVNGQMNARQILLDTDVVRVNGTGSANLGSETFDLTLKGDTKKFRVTHVFLPININGHFRSPSIGVQPGPAIAQGGVAVALGALLTPLAAILPFVDPGLAKNADCSALMAEAKASPAPVKGPLPTTPASIKKK
jgi:uncharacterized protein involved in outer membrane biogenesis